MKALVLGGVKSGKSRYAEQLACQCGKPVTVIATAIAGDDDMAARIKAHQKSRPAGWRVLEEPYDLSRALLSVTDAAAQGVARSADGQANNTACVIVDCLTLWITQLLCEDAPPVQIDDRVMQFIQAVSEFESDLILVSNETNMGVMPMDALSRQYCDQIGRLHQALANHVDHITLMVAGLPVTVK